MTLITIPTIQHGATTSPVWAELPLAAKPFSPLQQGTISGPEQFQTPAILGEPGLGAHPLLGREFHLLQQQFRQVGLG
jgi:hypothetical protein